MRIQLAENFLDLLLSSEYGPVHSSHELDGDSLAREIEAVLNRLKHGKLEFGRRPGTKMRVPASGESILPPKCYHMLF